MTCLNRDERERTAEERLAELEYSVAQATPKTGGPVSFFRFKPGWWYPAQFTYPEQGGLFTGSSCLTFAPLWASQDFGIDYLSLPTVGAVLGNPTYILGIYSNGAGHYPGDLLASSQQAMHDIQRVTDGGIQTMLASKLNFAFNSDIEFYWLAALVIKDPGQTQSPPVTVVRSFWNTVHNGHVIPDDNPFGRYGYTAFNHTELPATAPLDLIPVTTETSSQPYFVYCVNFRVAAPQMKDLGDWDENMASWIEAHLPSSISGSFMQYSDPPSYNPERALSFYWLLSGNELINEVSELHRYYTQKYGLEFADAVEEWMSSDFGTHTAVWDNADPSDNPSWDGIWSPFFEDA